jgi:DNA (cytosine-5)-methyltransferase 1
MEFKFIDLFAGIGGFRLALQSHGGNCVFSSEWDANSQDTYERNFGERPRGDITKIHEDEIPSHDVICGGFPCQAFSISGKQKGFEDARGTLFYDVARIARHHKPKVLFLENVKNLVRHDSGRTMQVILATLDEIGYNVYSRVLCSSDYGVPQARERVYIVAFRKDLDSTQFKFPSPSKKTVTVSDVLESEIDFGPYLISRPDMTFFLKEVTDPRRPRQVGKINKGGQGERIYSINAAGITLSAYGGGAASKTGAYLVDDNTVRKLTPRECARLQGFPERYKIHENRNLAYKQFGDSVSVPVLTAIFGEIKKIIQSN